jgi:alcohol dehydrogenase class IV
MDIMPSHTFRAVSYAWRLYAGVDALHHLTEEVRRHKAQRAFVVCGQTVAQKTNLLKRVQDQLGTLYAGVFDAMDKDSTWPAVEKGTAAARAAGAGRAVGAPLP